MSSILTRRLLRSAAVAVGATVLAGCSMFSSPDPRVDPAPLTEYAPSLGVRAAWTASVGRGGGLGFAPVVVGDAVYAAAADGSVGKYELASGKALWQTSLKNTLSAGVGSDGITTAVATPQGEVIALDDSGQEKWRARATSGVSIPPLVFGGVVVVRSSDYRIQAFDVQTGNRIWSVQRPGPALSLRAPMQMVGTEGLILTGLPGGRLIAIQAGTGSIQWEGIVATPKGAGDLDRVTDVVGAPHLAGPLMCAVAYQGRIVCFDVSAGGRPLWTKDFSSASGMAMDERLAYAPTAQGVMNAFTLDEGRNIWTQDALRNRRLTAPVSTGYAVAVGDLEGYVHFLARDDGRLLARLSAGGGAMVSPLLSTSYGVLAQTGNGSLIMIAVDG